MNLICAKHHRSEAVARCVTCGEHLCDDCRLRIGVRNYCDPCRMQRQQVVSPPPPPPPPLPPAQGATPILDLNAAEVAAKTRAASKKSPTLAAFLSLLPGLGQAYAGSWMRGVMFFVAAQAIKDWSMLTPLLASFLFAFNLWDAYRITDARNARVERKKPSKWVQADETMFTLVGLGCVGITLVQFGGLAAMAPATLVPLGAIAAGLLIAQETRRA